MPPPTRLSTQSATAGSSTTTTIEQTSIPIRRIQPTLVLRAEPAERRHVQWAQDVVNNEGMGKKSSKVCCIYHRPHAVDESSGDESSDSSSSDDDSDSEPDDGQARPVGGSRSRRGRKPHKHDCDSPGHDHDHGNEGNAGSAKGKGKGRLRKSSPNAYEKQPNYSKKPQGQ